jgi:DNA (cytosine-5)-methyltransferase 1
MSLTVGSLFSGIGGLDLGLERAGMRVIWQSEIDPYACRVLAKHWPEVPNHGDIKQIDWGTVERPDVICGGYPCQPFSVAGKRRGTDDPRHLWPWVRAAISALRPRFAILENVRGHLSMGGTVVIGELAEIGYDAEWRVVSAAGLGAPHRRDRIIIVAYPHNHGSFTGTVTGGIGKTYGYAPERPDGSANIERRRGVLADASGEYLESGISRECGESVSERTPLQVPTDRGRGVTGIAGEWWKVEPDVGRVANGVSSRVDRLRGLGNAVVPQVAEYIGRLVMAAA